MLPPSFCARARTAAPSGPALHPALTSLHTRSRPPTPLALPLAPAERVTLLSLLFQLSFCLPGDVFDVDVVPDEAARFLDDLQSFGVVIKSRNGRRWVLSPSLSEA